MAGAADMVIYGVSNTIQTLLRCERITRSLQAFHFPGVERLLVSMCRAGSDLCCLDVLIAPSL